MRLKDLEKYKNIVIQCHDNPDADAIGSGYGLYCYFKSKGNNVRFLYSGKNIIQKSNLKLMIEKLEIPIEYIPENDAMVVSTALQQADSLLITVDCQYGAGNVTRIKALNIAIIDHHQIESDDVKFSHIISDIGSCSTIVYNMLLEEGYEVNDDNHLATALYYGLLTDTNRFTEIHNHIDRDMQDSIQFNNADIVLFCNSNISLKELEIAGIAMLRYSYNDEYNFAVIKSQPCDANILGLISDFLLQVDQIYTCVVFNEVDGGFKLSVRSSIKEVNASELAAFLTKDIGSGGGHFLKAGGFISQRLYENKYGNMHSEAYFNNRMIEYYENYELIYANKYVADTESMQLYQKKNIPVGFVYAKDVLPIGTPITVRTIEGDMDLTIEEDLVIMIGIEGEVYPNRLTKFNIAYKILDEAYDFDKCVINNSYVPLIKNRLDGKKYMITDYARACVPTGKIKIFAKPLEKEVKVFTDWDKEKYMVGKIGDMLAVRSDDLHDVYVVDKTVFDYTYELNNE